MPKLIQLTPHHPDFPAVKQLMESAFPINERPLTLEQIFALSGRVSMDLLGIYPDETPDRFAGFFLTLKGGPFVYLSFFAICPENRSSGLGSKAIGALKEYYQDKQLLFSYESPYQESDNAQQRERRRAFYLKNGFYETGWFITVGNMEFILASSKDAFDKEAFVRLMAELLADAGLPNNPLPKLYRRD